MISKAFFLELYLCTWAISFLPDNGNLSIFGDALDLDNQAKPHFQFIFGHALDLDNQAKPHFQFKTVTDVDFKFGWA